MITTPKKKKNEDLKNEDLKLKNESFKIENEIESFDFSGDSGNRFIKFFVSLNNIENVSTITVLVYGVIYNKASLYKMNKIKFIKKLEKDNKKRSEEKRKPLSENLYDYPVCIPFEDFQNDIGLSWHTFTKSIETLENLGIIESSDDKPKKYRVLIDFGKEPDSKIMKLIKNKADNKNNKNKDNKNKDKSNDGNKNKDDKLSKSNFTKSSLSKNKTVATDIIDVIEDPHTEDSHTEDPLVENSVDNVENFFESFENVADLIENDMNGVVENSVENFSKSEDDVGNCAENSTENNVEDVAEDTFDW